MSQQLVKKGTNGKHENVMPRSWIEAIKDKNTGQTLVEILQGFNMYFLPYNGNTSSTRCLVPTILRKKGLWITYVKYDGNVYTEWYAADKIDDKSWGDSSNWRIGNNTLVGDITISANGNWVINGTETEFKAVGEKGNTPLLRVANNRLQVSYDLGDTYIDVTDNPVYTKFRWLATSGDTQSNNVGRIQASTDEGKTWTNMSNDFTNNLHIKKYIGVNESLPTSGIAEGTIYAKGPYYAEDDTLNDNPIYRLWVYAWKGNTLAWQDNGEFTSITAGVVQEMGDSETEVMSQKAVTEKLSELESEVKSFIKEDTTSDFSVTDENGEQIVKFESGEVKTKKFSSAKTVNIEDDDNDLSISDVNGNDIIKINDGGIETKKFKSSYKKGYTPKYERFTVYINKTPVGKFDDKSPRKNGDKPEAIVSVKGVIALPKTYTPNGEPCRLLLFAHGSSGNVTDTEWYNNKSSFINDFIPFWLSQGYAVFDCNAVPDGEARLSNGVSTLSNPVGLPDNMQAYLKSYEYIVNNYNVKPQMYVWACSAGGPVPLNFLFMRSGIIAAIAECGGILDIKDEIWGQSHQYPSDHKPDLAKRLGFDDVSGNTWEHDKADIWNPFSRIKEIDGKNYAFGFNAPIYILHGTSDRVLYQFEKRNTFADALINGGSICSIKWYDGFTHDDVCMGEKHIVLEDVCKWFNRF